MVIVGIDPSYTRSGIIVYKDKDNYKCYSIAPEDKGTSIVTLTEAMKQASNIGRQLKAILKEIDEPYTVVVEYPIMSTRLGSYLGIITAKFDSLFSALKCGRVIYLPAVACGAFTKATTKSDLVKFVKEHDFVTDFKGNHDEATAVVLAEVGMKVLNGTYKNSHLETTY